LRRYLNAKNDNAVRNALVRLGWESTRLRWAKKQQRVWAKKGLMVENNRIMSLDFAANYDGAVEKRFIWFSLGFLVDATWRSLKDTKIKARFNSHVEFDLDSDLGDDANGPLWYEFYESAA